jgi:hypothetical protein
MGGFGSEATYNSKFSVLKLNQVQGNGPRGLFTNSSNLINQTSFSNQF